jgi:cytochrome c oxidase assembly protein subunit 15
MQMIHRGMAALILIGVIYTAGSAIRRLGNAHLLAKGSAIWAGLILMQVFLGATTIWTNKSADIATAHVAVGAVSLVWGALLVLVSRRVLQVPLAERTLHMEPREVMA